MQKMLTFTVVTGLLALGAVPAASAVAADLPVAGVVTLDGSPVASTEVGWFDPYTGASGETQTAADGTYALTVPDGLAYVIYAGLDHNAKGRWLPLGGDAYLGSFVGSTGADFLYQSLTAFTAPTTQNIALAHPGSIVGKAKGLANQRVLLSSPVGQRIKTVRASATGRYEFSGLVPGRYRISAFEPLQAYEPYESKDLVVAVGASTRLSPQLTRSGSVTGVVTVAGKPAKGVIVSVANVNIENGTTTDARGRYTVKHVPAGRAELWFSGQGVPSTNDYWFRTYQKRVKVRVTSGRTRTVDVAAPRPTTLTATIVPTRGAKSLSIRLVHGSKYPAVDHYEKVGNKTTTVSVSLRGIAAGRYTLVVTDSTNKHYVKKTITLRYGKATALGTLRLTKKTVTLSGTVTAPSKASVSFANPFAYPVAGKVTGSHYRITGIVPGAGAVRVGAGGRSTSAPYFVDDRYYKLHPTKSQKFNVTAGGPQIGVVTGTAMVNGFQVFSTFSIDGGSEDIPLASNGDYRANLVYVTHSKLDGEVGINGAASYRLTDQFSGFKADFITGSPYWFDLPGGSVSLTSSRGTKTDVGVVAFEVHR